jgi:methyl acetate hydrolase
VGAWPEIDELYERATSDDSLPGVVAVAGDRDGILYEAAFGRLSVAGEEPVRTDTVFALASMTKAFTSVAALQLIEQGRLQLEQPVADVLPAFGQLQVLEGFDGAQPRLRAPARQASMRELLTHTSGLGYSFANAEILRYHELTGTPEVTSGLLAALEAPLVSDPGTRWEYGTSSDWLGQVVEAVSGSDLASYCAEHIFAPLSMRDTSFAPSAEQQARMMTLHQRTPAGELIVSPFAFPEPEFAAGGSGAFGTGADYLRFMRALLRGGQLDGERILAQATVALAFSDQLAGASLPGAIRTARPELTNDVPAFPLAQGWGLGFHLVLQDIPGMRSAGTGDWAGLFNCFYWIDRAAGVAGAQLTQLLPFFDLRVLASAAGFEQGVYARLATPAPA